MCAQKVFHIVCICLTLIALIHSSDPSRFTHNNSAVLASSEHFFISASDLAHHLILVSAGAAIAEAVMETQDIH